MTRPWYDPPADEEWVTGEDKRISLTSLQERFAEAVMETLSDLLDSATVEHGGRGITPGAVVAMALATGIVGAIFATLEPRFGKALWAEFEPTMIAPDRAFLSALHQEFPEFFDAAS